MTTLTLLPPYRGDAETALATAVAEQFPIPTPAGDLWNPSRCPAHLLGWLAWALSVDEWNPDWPVAIKRSIVASAVEVHRRKGTRSAVLSRLAALGYRTDLSEWFEHEGAPHTFRIDVYADDIFDAGGQIDARLVAQISDAISGAKPVRAHYALRVGEGFDSADYLRTGVRQAHLHQAEVDPGPRPAQAACATALRAGLRAARIFAHTHEPTPRPANASVAVFLRLGSRALAVSREFHDVQRRAG
ncbi:MAG: phage tail protein I [Rhodobacteraceae bacterium]|nr:phage tail protein I [Paracoccaceae bacterium]